MFHPRSSKKKIEQIARVLEAAARSKPGRTSDGFWSAVESGAPVWPAGLALAEKLRAGLATKSFALSEGDSAAIVHALEYALVNGSGSADRSADDELEKLHQETAKQFVSTYGHSPYANE
jgi:hypothetical protein